MFDHFYGTGALFEALKNPMLTHRARLVKLTLHRLVNRRDRHKTKGTLEM